MPATLTTAQVSSTIVGDTWVVGVLSTDEDGLAVEVVPTVTVVSPVGATTTPTAVATEVDGLYRVSVTLSTAGRWLLTASVAGDAPGKVAAVVQVEATTPASGMPSITGLRAYLAEVADAWDTDSLTAAMTAEMAAQRRVCQVGPVYPADLLEALYRRVSVNLAKRPIPLAVVGEMSEGGARRLPGRDPEIARLEAPHRKVIFG